MKQLSTGTGLAVLGISAIACVVLSGSRLGSGTQALANSPVPTAIATATLAQTTATIVWYGVVQNTRHANVSNSCGNVCNQSFEFMIVARAWSDGTIEAKKIATGSDYNSALAIGSWTVVSTANEGQAAFADLDFNAEVDGGDLAMVLLNFGDAPRQDIPPSDCPLNLINPR